MMVGNLKKIVLGIGGTLVLTTNAFSDANLFGRYNDVICTGEGKTAICVAVGFRMEPVSNLYPLLIESTDGGKNYQLEKKVNALDHGTLLTVDCSEKTAATYCVAAGYLGDSKAHATPLLLESKNNAKSWKAKPIEGLEQGLLKKIRCTGDKENTFCAGIGWSVLNLSDSKPVPFIFQSKNFGKWKIKSIKNLPALATLTVLSCTDSSENAMCVAGGYDKEHQTPWLVQTTDGGKSWKIQNLGFKLDKAAAFEEASCAGKGPTATCVIVGNAGHDALILQTTNRGTTWENPTYPNSYSSRTYLHTVQCTEKTTGGVQCQVAGDHDYYDGEFYYGVLGFLDNNGQWVESADSGDTGRRYFTSTCTKNNDMCLVSGEINYSNAPLIKKNNGDFSTHWVQQELTNYPYNGLLRKSSCTGSGQKSICVAVGYNTRFGFAPLLIQSRDGGITWLSKDVHL